MTKLQFGVAMLKGNEASCDQSPWTCGWYGIRL
jgi:hypothetical protein